MTFAFKRQSPTPGADLRRIALGRLTASLDLIASGPADQATVHELRRNIKRLRAVLALCGPGKGRARRLDRQLRDAGRALAPLRDADALVALFDDLAAPLDHPDLPAARASLASGAPDDPDTRAATVAGHAKTLGAIHADLTDWRVPVASYATLETHLARAHKKARALMGPALADPRGETLHDWRKRVKTHGFHAQLLRPMRPARLDAHAADLDRLGDLLGDARDCALLAERLEAAGLAAPVAALARARETAGLEQAADLGQRLFDGKGAALARRWRKWWHAWKGPGGRAAARRP